MADRPLSEPAGTPQADDAWGLRDAIQALTHIDATYRWVELLAASVLCSGHHCISVECLRSHALGRSRASRIRAGLRSGRR